MQNVKQTIANEFKRRVFEESYQRIFKCLSLLEEDMLWESPNTAIPSVGNLILHICGNARQWVLSGIGGKEDNRDRDSEFIPHRNIKKSELIFLMENLRANLEEVIDEMPSEQLSEKIVVQGFKETGFSILIHVIEHFSYHTGQISTLTKIFTQLNLEYYKGQDLNQLTKLN